MQLLVCIALLALGAAQEPLAGVPMAIAPNANTTAPNATGAALAPDSPNVDAGGVVIKTWGFLRETTDALGAHTQDVLRVRQDLKDMATDEAEQRKAWSAANQEMAAQNRVLQVQVEQARTAPPVTKFQTEVSQLQTELKAAQEQTRLARQNRTVLQLAWEGKQKTYVAQVQALNTRIQQAHTEMMLGQEATARALHEAQLSKQQLEQQVTDLQHQIEA